MRTYQHQKQTEETVAQVEVLETFLTEHQEFQVQAHREMMVVLERPCQVVVEEEQVRWEPQLVEAQVEQEAQVRQTIFQVQLRHTLLEARVEIIVVEFLVQLVVLIQETVVEQEMVVEETVVLVVQVWL